MLTLEKINTSTSAEARILLEPLIERSPLLAAKLADRRPFPSTAVLCVALDEELHSLTEVECVTLFNAHPELGPNNPTEMTQASQAEQGRLGLTSGTLAERALLDDLNTTYRDKFGFPFITALARHETLSSVLGEFERRLGADRATEIATTLEQISTVSAARITASFEQAQSAAIAAVGSAP